MKRYGGLCPRLIAFPNLLSAFENAARGKRRLSNVAAFQFDLEKQLCHLQDELRTQTYVPGPYHTFHIWRPKQRLISAAPFRDRVVHHALYNVLEPVFEPIFIRDSSANQRIGRARPNSSSTSIGRLTRRRLPLDKPPPAHQD